MFRVGLLIAVSVAGLSVSGVQLQSMKKDNGRQISAGNSEIFIFISVSRFCVRAAPWPGYKKKVWNCNI